MGVGVRRRAASRKKARGRSGAPKRQSRGADSVHPAPPGLSWLRTVAVVERPLCHALRRHNSTSDGFRTPVCRCGSRSRLTIWCVIAGGHALLVRDMIDRSVLTHELLAGIAIVHLLSLVSELARPGAVRFEGHRHHVRGEARKGRPRPKPAISWGSWTGWRSRSSIYVTTARTRCQPCCTTWTPPPSPAAVPRAGGGLRSLPTWINGMQ